jgi:hypothetical protein
VRLYSKVEKIRQLSQCQSVTDTAIGKPEGIAEELKRMKLLPVGALLCIGVAIFALDVLANQVLKGSAGADHIEGSSMNDEIASLGGPDVLEGKSGNDQLSGGSGNDTLDGGSGNDILDGGEGNDTLKGGPGEDVLKGGRGNDILFGGLGHDILYGGLGADQFVIDFSSWSSVDFGDVEPDEISDFEPEEGDSIWFRIDSNQRGTRFPTELTIKNVRLGFDGDVEIKLLDESWFSALRIKRADLRLEVDDFGDEVTLKFSRKF